MADATRGVRALNLFSFRVRSSCYAVCFGASSFVLDVNVTRWLFSRYSFAEIYIFTNDEQTKADWASRSDLAVRCCARLLTFQKKQNTTQHNTTLRWTVSRVIISSETHWLREQCLLIRPFLCSVEKRREHLSLHCCSWWLELIVLDVSDISLVETADLDPTTFRITSMSSIEVSLLTPNYKMESGTDRPTRRMQRPPPPPPPASRAAPTQSSSSSSRHVQQAPPYPTRRRSDCDSKKRHLPGSSRDVRFTDPSSRRETNISLVSREKISIDPIDLPLFTDRNSIACSPTSITSSCATRFSIADWWIVTSPLFSGESFCIVYLVTPINGLRCSKPHDVITNSWFRRIRSILTRPLMNRQRLGMPIIHSLKIEM